MDYNATTTEWDTMNDTLGLNKSDDFKVIVEGFQLYFTPILVILGSVGNVVSVIVFSTTNLRKLSSSYYLASLAVSDTLFLGTTLVSWLGMVDVNLYNTYVGCKLATFVSYATCFLSSWLVVAFTVERFIAVSYPLKRPSMCTVSRAKYVIAALTVLTVVAFSPYTFITGLRVVAVNGSNATMCYPDEDDMDLLQSMNYVDTVFTLVLPFIVIATLNACIVRTVWKLARIRRSMTLTVRNGKKLEHGKSFVGSRASTELGATPKKKGAFRAANSQTKVTKMLLVVSTVFIALNLPSYVFRVMVFFLQDKEQNTGFMVLQHVCNLLFHSNFAINFVLYCVSGQNFRRSLCTLCCPESVRRRHHAAHPTVVSELRPTSSMGRRRTTGTYNGLQSSDTWQDAHEMLPLTK